MIKPSQRTKRRREEVEKPSGDSVSADGSSASAVASDIITLSRRTIVRSMRTRWAWRARDFGSKDLSRFVVGVILRKDGSEDRGVIIRDITSSWDTRQCFLIANKRTGELCKQRFTALDLMLLGYRAVGSVSSERVSRMCRSNKDRIGKLTVKKQGNPNLCNNGIRVHVSKVGVVLKGDMILKGRLTLNADPKTRRVLGVKVECPICHKPVGVTMMKRGGGGIFLIRHKAKEATSKRTKRKEVESVRTRRV